jgi:hypothetical protein
VAELFQLQATFSFYDRQGQAKKIALRTITTATDQKFRLRKRFNTFGHYVKTNATGQGRDARTIEAAFSSSGSPVTND